MDLEHNIKGFRKTIPLRLHLGCGNEYKKGWINIDIDRNVKADKYCNLNKRLPFNDNSVDEIYSKNTLEHIDNHIGLIREIYRTLKKGRVFKFRVPLSNTMTTFCDLTHIRGYTPQAFNDTKRPYYKFHFRHRKFWVTLPLFHSIKFPYQFMYVNKFIEVFTGLEGELTK